MYSGSAQGVVECVINVRYYYYYDIHVDLCGINPDLSGEECYEIEENQRKNNSERAYKCVENVTTVIQEKASTVQDRSGKCLTDERIIIIIIIVTYIYNALNDALSASRIHNKLKTILSKYIHILNRQS